LNSKEVIENIVAFGHENIQATHPSTLMFTKDKHLSNAGDCIVAASSDKSLADLSHSFKNILRKPNAKLTIAIEAGGLIEKINAFGSSKLTFAHSTDMVVRKSAYISDRTLAILADKSSNDLSRKLIEKLKNPEQKITITLYVQS
jgi:hypothetical protein